MSGRQGFVALQQLLWVYTQWCVLGHPVGLLVTVIPRIPVKKRKRAREAKRGRGRKREK